MSTKEKFVFSLGIGQQLANSIKFDFNEDGEGYLTNSAMTLLGKSRFYTQL